MSTMIPFPGTFHGEERDERTVMVPAARLTLQATAGPLRGQEFTFDGDRFVIGRSASCTVTIPNQSVSRNHARIEYTNGSYWLISDKSVNGTRLNGALIQEPTQLADQDQIVIEDSIFVIRCLDLDRGLDIGELAPPPAPAPAEAARSSAATLPSQYPAYPSSYPPAAPYMAPQFQPPFQPAPRHDRRWLPWLAGGVGLVVIVIGVVVTTVKLVAQPTAVPQAPAAEPFVAMTPTFAVVAPAPAPPAPPSHPIAAPAPTVIAGVLAIETTPVLADAPATVVDVVAVGTTVERNGAIGHARLNSANFTQARAKLLNLQRQFGASPEHADFIAQARQDYVIANKRREVHPIVASIGGTITRVAVKLGDELRLHQKIAEITVARITVPIAAVEGTGKRCTAELGSGKKLTGAMLSVGSTERTLELDHVPTDAPGAIGDVRIHCTD